MATTCKAAKKRELTVHRGAISNWEIHVLTHGASGRKNNQSGGCPRSLI